MYHHAECFFVGSFGPFGGVPNISKYFVFSKVVDLAESFRMRYSRASGRPLLSRYGNLCVDDQPLPKENISHPKTFQSHAGVMCTYLCSSQTVRMVRDLTKKEIQSQRSPQRSADVQRRAHSSFEKLKKGDGDTFFASVGNSNTTALPLFLKQL